MFLTSKLQSSNCSLLNKFIAFSCRAWILRFLCRSEYSFQLFLFLDGVLLKSWPLLNSRASFNFSFLSLCWTTSCCKDTFSAFTLSSSPSTTCFVDWSFTAISFSVLFCSFTVWSSRESCAFSARSDERISVSLKVISQLFLRHLSSKIFLWREFWRLKALPMRHNFAFSNDRSLVLGYASKCDDLFMAFIIIRSSFLSRGAVDEIMSPLISLSDERSTVGFPCRSGFEMVYKKKLRRKAQWKLL